MRENEHESFYKYFRRTTERFDHILSLLGPMLSKKSLYRGPINSDDSTFLSHSGDSLQTISFSYRLGHTTVSRITT